MSKIATDVNVRRIGVQHQAGSDSLLTSEIFFKLKKILPNKEVCNFINNNSGIIWGLGDGAKDVPCGPNGGAKGDM